MQQKSNIMLGAEPKKLSNTVKIQESVNRTPMKGMDYMRQSH